MISLDNVHAHAYIKLARINLLAWTPYPLAFIVGVSAANNYDFWIFPALIAIFFFTATGYALNFYADAKSRVDRFATFKDMKLSENPVLKGEVSDEQVFKFTILTSILATISAYFTPDIFKLSLLVAAFFGVFCYNILYWKSKPILDVFSMPVGVLSVLAMGGMLKIFPVEFMLYVFLTVPLYLETELWDIDADKKARLKTTAVFLGEKKTAIVNKIFYLALLTFSIVYFNYNNLFCSFLITIAIFDLVVQNIRKKIYFSFGMLYLYVIVSFSSYFLVKIGLLNTHGVFQSFFT